MGRKTIYPWDDWFSRKNKFKLLRGKDFNCQPYVMGQQIRTEARLNWGNPKVSVLIVEDVVVVEITPKRKKRK